MEVDCSYEASTKNIIEWEENSKERENNTHLSPCILFNNKRKRKLKVVIEYLDKKKMGAFDI